MLFDYTAYIFFNYFFPRTFWPSDKVNLQTKSFYLMEWNKFVLNSTYFVLTQHCPKQDIVCPTLEKHIKNDFTFSN